MPLWQWLRSQNADAWFTLKATGHERLGAPVRVERLVGQLGAHLQYVQNAEWDAALDGTGDTPVIYVNVEQPATRQRFSIAHELGHLLLHEAGVVFRDTRRRKGAKPWEEKQANEFAADLLMPVPWVESARAYIGRDPDRLANIFAVSSQAMSYRLDNIDSGRVR